MDRTRESTACGLVRSPVRELPALHQIVLPTPWDVGPVQIYLLEGDPLTLVDTGVRSAESRMVLEGALDELGYGLADVRRVVLTHYHGDHLGQVQTIRDCGPGLELLAHEEDAEMCDFFSAERDERIEDTEALFREYGVAPDLLARQTTMRRRWATQDPLCDASRVDVRLRHGDCVAQKGLGLEVLHAPGHTAGHILLYEEHSGVLLTGDHVMGNAVPYTDNFLLEESPDPADALRRKPRFRGLPHYMESLRRLRGGSFRTILPAHGGIIDRPARAIDDALLFYEVRVQRIERALRRLADAGGAVTAWEIWQKLFPKADSVTQMRTRMLMVIGGLDVLEDERRLIVRRRQDGVLTFEPRSR
jgi:glyoxylase-like metal-dependent hydrolase (beta-lactamase superfamily II)